MSESNIYITLADTQIVQYGLFYRKDMDYFFNTRPEKIHIDSFTYQYNKATRIKKVNSSFSITYPDTNMYRVIDRQFASVSNYHSSSLRSLIYGLTDRNDPIPGKYWKNSVSITDRYQGENVYMNCGELRDINQISITDQNGNVLFSRKINGDDQNIDDFFDRSGYEQLNIQIRGHYYIDFTINII